MRCKTAQRLMMDRLFETLSGEQETLLESHLQTCPHCAAEWQEVQSAHAWIAATPDCVIPAHLEEAVLHARQSAPSQIPHTPFFFRRWAVAAGFLLLVCASYPVWQKMQSKPASTTLNSTGIAGSSSQELMEKIKQPLASPRETLQSLGYTHASLTSSQSGTSQLAASPLGDTKPGRLAVIAPQNPVAHNAEDLFKTGLHLYNNAFTKIGDDQKTLLRSAILMLQDVEERYPEEVQWIAMSMILIADAHRALDETREAVTTYRRMIERFPQMPEYTRQARASMLKLILTQNDELSEAEQVLTQYRQQTPPPLEFASLAMTYSDRIAAASPEGAMIWYRQVMDSLPDQHPLRNQATEKMNQLTQAVRSHYYIQDWQIAGPFPQETLPKSNGDGHAGLFQSILSIAKGERDSLLVENKNDGNPDINVADLLKQSPKKACAYASTYIYSPQDRWVYLQVGFTDGYRVWLNRDPISNWVGEMVFQRDAVAIHSHFIKGWNSLLLKLYHIRPVQEWNFSLIITDDQGQLIPDLRTSPYDPANAPKKP